MMLLPLVVRARARSVLCAACVALTATAAAQADLDGLPLEEEAALRAAVARVAPAVVRVQATGVSEAALAAAEATPASGPSTGLVVGPDGWVITTSFAVPADATEAVVAWPTAASTQPAETGATPPLPSTGAARRAARVVGRDRSRGLVLLKLEAPGPPAFDEVAPRSELGVGQWTIAVGRAWDLAVPGVAVGILSATNRSWGRSVQTDASISPANYGGPLVDIRGRVIGILAPLPADTAGMNLGTELYDAGIGFAVPMEDILRVLPRLERGETLVPGVLGIGYASRDPFTGEPRIATCRPGSPAAKAGLRAGDLIVAAGGQPLRRIAELRHVLAPLYAGDAVDLTVERRPATTPEDRAAEPQRFDVRVELAAELPRWRRPLVGIGPARSSAREAAAGPVRVAWVWPGSPAATAGIAPGDLVEAFVPAAVEGQPADEAKVESAAALAGMVAGVEIGQEFGLVVSRDGGRRTVKLAAQPMPGDLPADLSAAVVDGPATAGREGATVERLAAVEMAKPTLAVVPAVPPTEPLGALIFLDVPRGDLNDSAAAAWKLVAARHGIAVILPAPSDPQRWGREDIAGIRRAIAGLAAKRAIDPTRIAVAGRAAGGAFAWLVAEALGPTARGVALIDAGLPRQATIEPVEPGRSRWVVFGTTAADPSGAEGRRAADRRRLEDAGYVAGSLPATDAGELPVAAIAAWVEALGCL